MGCQLACLAQLSVDRTKFKQKNRLKQENQSRRYQVPARTPHTTHPSTGDGEPVADPGDRQGAEGVGESALTRIWHFLSCGQGTYHRMTEEALPIT
jgi:hypothetical protein